mmetsp:Transcript_15271/g.21412  ORF Transcript_15271/g.21412 Transcript_15271/m.21412 type:complete len:93 (-) Transcript_15271:87-365(-)
MQTDSTESIGFLSLFAKIFLGVLGVLIPFPLVVLGLTLLYESGLKIPKMIKEIAPATPMLRFASMTALTWGGIKTAPSDVGRNIKPARRCGS